MANSDRLKQTISNLQILTDLMNDMIDAEMYPVSFFSQAFDLIQKIQSDIHTLEADQVELFAGQMKKHQALILSIHQQMRNISDDAHMQKPAQPPLSPVMQSRQPENSGISTTVPPVRSVNPTLASDGTKTVLHPEIHNNATEKAKKVSFLDRLGFQKKNDVVTDQKISDVPEKNEAKINVPDEKKSAPVIIEDAIKVPVNKDAPKTEQIASAPEQNTEPVASAFVPEQITPVTEQIPATVLTTPTVAEPVAIATEQITPTVAEPVAIAATQGSHEPAKVDVETSYTEKSPEKKVVTASLNDVMEKNNIMDLRKAFSLNDRFRYRKELFGGNEELMYKVIAALNNKGSFKDSITFIEEKLHWDFSDPIVKEFIKVLEIRFL